MKHLRVSKRYAKALLAISLENNVEEQVYNDMKIIYNAFKASSELRILIKSPIVRENKKINIMKEIFEDYLHDFTLNYLNIIIKKNRAVLIYSIAYQYNYVYSDFLGIENVKVITATELDDKLMSRVTDVAKKITNKKIRIESVLDKKIIGGFILNVGTKQYDASIRNKLSKMKKHLGY